MFSYLDDGQGRISELPSFMGRSNPLDLRTCLGGHAGRRCRLAPLSLIPSGCLHLRQRPQGMFVSPEHEDNSAIASRGISRKHIGAQELLASYIEVSQDRTQERNAEWTKKPAFL